MNKVCLKNLVKQCIKDLGNRNGRVYASVAEGYYRGADKSLARPGKKQAVLFIIIIGGTLLLFMYITRHIKRNILTINQNTSEVGQAKDLTALPVCIV
jgi:hypothetical protein